MKTEHNDYNLNRAAQAPFWGSMADAIVFIGLPARFPFHPPAAYYVKVENTYTPTASSCTRVAQAAFLLAKPARP